MRFKFNFQNNLPEEWINTFYKQFHNTYNDPDTFIKDKKDANKQVAEFFANLFIDVFTNKYDYDNDVAFLTEDPFEKYSLINEQLIEKFENEKQGYANEHMKNMDFNQFSIYKDLNKKGKESTVLNDIFIKKLSELPHEGFLSIINNYKNDYMDEYSLSYEDNANKGKFVLDALKKAQTERGLLTRFIYWITGKTGKEDEIINEIETNLIDGERIKIERESKDNLVNDKVLINAKEAEENLISSKDAIKEPKQLNPVFDITKQYIFNSDTYDELRSHGKTLFGYGKLRISEMTDINTYKNDIKYLSYAIEAYKRNKLNGEYDKDKELYDSHTNQIKDCLKALSIEEFAFDNVIISNTIDHESEISSYLLKHADHKKFQKEVEEAFEERENYLISTGYYSRNI